MGKREVQKKNHRKNSKKITKLERENKCLKKSLEHAELQKKSELFGIPTGGSRNRRERIIEEVNAISGVVGVHRACETLGIFRATYYRRLTPAVP